MTAPANAPRVRQHVVDGRGGPVPVRDHLPRDPGSGAPLVWIHGGGFSNGGLDQTESDAPAREWARRGRLVRTVDYRLAKRARAGSRAPLSTLPNRFPAGLHDVLDAVQDLVARRGPVFVGGASAGACLAASAAIDLRDRGMRAPLGLVLAYGTFHARLPADDEVEHQVHGLGRLLFGPRMVRSMHLNYVGDEALLRPGLAFPGGTDLRGLPPSLVLDADNDRLRASGHAFAEELTASGVRVEREVVAGSAHGFLDRPRGAAFRAAVDRTAAWLHEHDRPSDEGNPA